MMKLKVLAGYVLLGAVLSACSTTPNPLSADQRSSMFVAGYDMQYTNYKKLAKGQPKDAEREVNFVLRRDDDTSGDAAENEVAVAALRAEHEAVTATAAEKRNGRKPTTFQKERLAKQKIRDDAAIKRLEKALGEKDQIRQFLTKLETAVAREFKVSPSGSNPVIIKVNISGYSRIGAGQAIPIGGSDMVAGSVTFVNANTNEELGAFATLALRQKSGWAAVLVDAATKPDIDGQLAVMFAKDLRRKFDAKQ